MPLLDALLIAFLFLQAYDFYSTNEVLRKRTGYEKNPLLRLLMDRVGVVGTLLVKTAASIAAGAYLYLHNEVEILAVLVAFYVYFMYQNYKVLNKK